MRNTRWAPKRLASQPVKRHSDRLGHGIGGDDPGALRRRDAERAGDRRHRDIGDGGVEHHQEVAQSDRGAGRDQQRAASQRRALPRPVACEVAVVMTVLPFEGLGQVSVATSMSAFIESPTFSGWAASSLGSRAMRTGNRCTTLIQLPVAFCAGTMASAATGAAGEADDAAVIDDVVAVKVAGEFGGLARAHLCELHFLEVGVHIGLLDRHHGHQRRAGLDHLADLHLPLGHDAVDRARGRPCVPGPRAPG